MSLGNVRSSIMWTYYKVKESQNTTLQIVAGSFTMQSSFLIFVKPLWIHVLIIGNKFIYQVVIFFAVCSHSPNKSNDLHACLPSNSFINY